MTHGSLYSGIGGWLLAARWAGIENVFTCEIDKFCNKILDKHFPDTDRHYDIKETDFTKYAGRIDILSTSDPCQPFSFAVKRGGKADDRYLWPQTIRVIREIKPFYVVFENVPGFISLGFETVASDLEAEGYTVESFVIPACGLGARHIRDRLWIIANIKSDGFYLDGQGKRDKNMGDRIIEQRNVPETGQKGEILGGEFGRHFDIPGTGDGWLFESQLERTVHGIPSELDKCRIKSLGNSIVPQIAYIIFEAIKQINHE